MTGSIATNGLGLAEVVEFENEKFNKPQKPNSITNAENMYYCHHFGKPLLAVVRSILQGLSQINN